MTDYTKLSDKELLDITDPSINKGGIPLKAVKEEQRRFPENFTNRTVTSNDFDSQGKFIR
jgi:hypothetical protein